MNQVILYVLILISLVGCTTGMLRVESTPEGADVYLASDGQQPVKIGKTPLQLSSQQVQSSNSSSFQIKVKKEGFNTESYLLPSGMVTSSYVINVKMNERKLPLSCTEQTGMVDKVARSVALAQFHIQRRRYDQAEQVLVTLLSDNPESSVIYDLLGNVYYLDKRSDLALDAYENSLKLNPNAVETRRMVQKLKAIQSVRSPASGGE